MKRTIPLALIFAPAVLVYACSDSKSEDPPPTDTPETGTQADTSKPDDDAGNKPDEGTDPDTSNPATNPIEGITAPTAVVPIGALYAEGPVWRGDSLYFSEFKTPGGVVVKFTPPNPAVFHTVDNGTDLPLGNTFDEKNNSFITLEVPAIAAGGGTLVRTPLTGGAGTPIALTFDGGVNSFDSPNDLVVRKSDGTIYVSDPGYQKEIAGGLIGTNHIWRITPTGGVVETVVFFRPNGIALSPDDKTLYVSYTAAQPPHVTKYPVATDGSLGAGVEFAAVPPNDSAADGVAVDANGNVYVAVKDGVEVFKADGSKWGKIPATKGINGLAFGGADKRTLYMTTPTGILQVAVKVPGLAQ